MSQLFILLVYFIGFGFDGYIILMITITPYI